jgi:hypothetical protein
MIEFERISDLCQRLALGTMANHLPHVAEEAARDELSFQDFFERLLQAEYRERQERTRTVLTKTAGFPAIKTLEQFDFEFAAGAPKQQLKELFNLTFVERSENVVLLGRATLRAWVGLDHKQFTIRAMGHDVRRRRDDDGGYARSVTASRARRNDYWRELSIA